LKLLLLRIVIIGGGAAGFFAAITAASANPEAQVILLEASRQPLAKVRISGGGRCNVTNACFDPKGLVLNYPRGGKALLGAFNRFQPRDTMAWFAQQGVKLKTESDGRMFPKTDSSETIVNCLMDTANELGVEIRTAATVMEAKRLNSQDGFEVFLKSGEKLECDRLLIATGSNPVGYKIAKELGHEIEPPVPSLFTFNVLDKELRGLSGVSVPSVKLRLSCLEKNQPDKNQPDKNKLEQLGPLLITHWGLSGPAILKLSAWGARILHDSRYQGILTVNWLPEFQQEELRQKILTIKDESPRKTIALHRGVELPHRLWQYIISRAGIGFEDKWAGISNKTLNKLVQELTQGQYAFNGKGAFKEEFVTCGGVNLKQVNFKTMESRLIPHLYFAGEILDIDGITGGFNFQSAWTTAHLAGVAMAAKS
jgi:predicted Rossmann fold flavoprotein